MQLVPFELPGEKPTRVWDLAVPIVTVGNNHHIKITGDIDEPAMYDEFIFLLDQATPEDTFYITITTGGGVLDSAIAISNALKTTKAHTVAKLVASVASAGTVIALACKEIQVTPHLSFMCHTYSTMVGGKGNEVDSQQKFMKKYIEDFTRDTYQHFLTPRELSRMIKGEDFWFNSEQVLERLNNRKEASIE